MLLGRFEVVHAGTSIPLPVPAKVQSLVGYLALHRERTVSRKELARSLWPQSNEDQAGANLRKLLHQIRQSSHLALLVSQQPKGARFIPQYDATLDVAEFETAIFHGTTRALEYARSLYRGPLLPEVDDPWTVPKRADLQACYCQCLYALAERYLLHDMLGESLAAVQALTAEEPLNEDFVRLSLRIHSVRGDLPALTQTFERFAQAVKQIGNECTRETRELYRDLMQTLIRDASKHRPRGGSPPPAAAYVPTSRQTAGASPPNHLRAGGAAPEAIPALNQFERWISTPLAPQVFYLWAIPGGGKTTFLRQAARLAHSRGWHVAFLPPTPKRVARMISVRSRILFLVDDREQQWATWSDPEHPIHRWAPKIRITLTGATSPRRLWGEPSNWSRWVRVCTLDPMSPTAVADLLGAYGSADPSIVNEILSVSGGVPEAVVKAIGLWIQDGIERFWGDERWQQINDALAQRLRATIAETTIDPEILAVAALVKHVEPAMLASVLKRPVSAEEFRSLSDCVLFTQSAEGGVGLRGEVRRVLSQTLKHQRPLETMHLLHQVIGALLEDWTWRSGPEKERIASECLFSIREYRNLNPEGYLLPSSDLAVVPKTDSDIAEMRRILEFWLRQEQAASSNQIPGEWEQLLEYDGNRIRVVKDNRGILLGFNMGVPVTSGSREILRNSLTTGQIIAECDRPVNGTQGSPWVLRFVVYGPVRQASVATLLEDDLLGLIGVAAQVWVATPLTRYHRLLPMLGFRYLSGITHWNNGKLRPIRNYVLDLPEGFPGWIRRYFDTWPS